MTESGRGALPLDALAAKLALAADLAGPALVGARAKRRLVAIAESVPRVTRSFGFECRLGGDDDRVDLGIAVAPANGARSALARSLPDGCESWRRIGAFARAWADARDPLHVWSPFVFLEFDEESADQPPPVPSLFVALDSPLEGSSPASPEISAALRTVSLLRPASLEQGCTELVAAAFAALPPGGRVLHVAVMLGRADASLRLSVWLPAADVPRYFARLAAPGLAQVAERALAEAGHALAPAQLDFDLDPKSPPRIGLGLRPDVPGSVAWQRLLDRLESAAELSKAKREAVLGWPGVNVLRGDDGEAESVLRREISHVKIACAAGEASRLKVYLGVTPLLSR